MKHLLHGSAHTSTLCAMLCVTGDPLLNEDKDVGVVYRRYCLIHVFIAIGCSGNA